MRKSDPMFTSRTSSRYPISIPIRIRYFIIHDRLLEFQYLPLLVTRQIHLRINAGWDRSNSVIRNLHCFSKAYRIQRVYNGDSNGIGYCTARELLRSGAKVIKQNQTCELMRNNSWILSTYYIIINYVTYFWHQDNKNRINKRKIKHKWKVSDI